VGPLGKLATPGSIKPLVTPVNATSYIRYATSMSYATSQVIRQIS